MSRFPRLRVPIATAALLPCPLRAAAANWPIKGCDMQHTGCTHGATATVAHDAMRCAADRLVQWDLTGLQSIRFSCYAVNTNPDFQENQCESSSPVTKP